MIYTGAEGGVNASDESPT